MNTQPVTRRLIVNADDLGYDPEIDRGILEGHARGIVTSATAMVETAFAAAILRDAPRSLGIGLHCVVDPATDEASAFRLIEAQIARFTELRGELPTHLDSHKHAHAQAPILAAIAKVAKARELPVRALGKSMRQTLRAVGIRTTDHFLGDASQRPCWTAERLDAAIRSIESGFTEIMCHPGYPPNAAKTSFSKEREVELGAVCAEAVRQASQAVTLVHFGML